MQNFVNSSLGLIDTVMVGGLGEVEIAAVGLATQIHIIFIVFSLKPAEEVDLETKKLEKSLREVVTDIALSEEDTGMMLYLLSDKNFAGNTTTCNKNIIESIESVRLEALQEVNKLTTNREFAKYVRRCNEFFFGYIHARLDSF